MIASLAHERTYGPKRAHRSDSRRFGPSTLTCARFWTNLAHVNVLGKEIACWAALHLARMIGREHSSDRVVRPHDCKDADPHRRGPLVWMRQRTAVLSKTSHANCCTTLTNRPLRPREGRFVRVVQQLACEGFCENGCSTCAVSETSLRSL